MSKNLNIIVISLDHINEMHQNRAGHTASNTFNVQLNLWQTPLTSVYNIYSKLNTHIYIIYRTQIQDAAEVAQHPSF